MTDHLRDRIAAGDPMHDGVPTEPVSSAAAQRLLETIVTTPLDSTDRSPTSAAPTGPSSRPRWFIPAIAAGVLAIGGFAAMVAGGIFDSDDPSTTLALSTGDTDPAMMSCMALDSTLIAQSPVSFRAVVDDVEGERVTMTVDTWYQGGDADTVELTAPSGMEALIGGLDFAPGETYLVSAYDGVVSYCGMTGPATPELQAMYDAAFSG